MKVIGIDPAGSHTKGCHICDGTQIWKVAPRDMESKLADWSEQFPNLLICWDSPLSAGSGAVQTKSEIAEHDFSKRIIEQYYAQERKATKNNGRPLFRHSCDTKKRWQVLPKGISVGNFTGVSHWALSLRCFGYPELGGQMGASEGHFDLVTNDIPITDHKNQRVVEVHPALAAYLWVYGMEDALLVESWEYKKKNSSEIDQNLNPTSFYRLLMSIPAIRNLVPCEEMRDDPLKWRKEKSTKTSKHFSDDEFDAFVALVLGRLWVDKQGNDERVVRLMGDETTGCWLVPAAACRSIDEIKNQK